MAYLIHSVLPKPPRKIVSVQSEDTVKKCIELMTQEDIGAVVCFDKENNLMGIVSERDLLRHCLGQCKDLNTTPVSAVVYQKVSILSPHDTIEKAMKVITDTKRRHILIQEKDEFLAIVSIGDLLFHLLDNKAKIIEHLEQYIAT